MGSPEGFAIKCVCLWALFAKFAACLLDGYIGHFRVPLKLHFKSRLSAKSLLWKSVFIHIEIGTNYHNQNFTLRLALKERLWGTRKWPIGSVLSCTFANFMPSTLDQGKYFHWNSFSMMVPTGSRLQFWSPLAGLPWKPPHYASYFHGAPTNLRWNKSSSSSIGVAFNCTLL